MYFQDIYSNLWKVKVFSGNIYSFKSNTYFWGTVLFVQDGFLYLIMTRHKLTVHALKQEGEGGSYPGAPATAVRDLTRDGRWSTFYVHSVLRLSNVSFQGQCARMWNSLKLPSPTKLARLGHFPPASQAGCLAGLVFYVFVFSLGGMMGKIERTMGGGEGRYYWNCRYMSAVRHV